MNMSIRIIGKRLLQLGEILDDFFHTFLTLQVFSQTEMLKKRVFFDSHPDFWRLPYLYVGNPNEQGGPPVVLVHWTNHSYVREAHFLQWDLSCSASFQILQL